MPKKTLDAIVGSGNHYVVNVKGNQPELFAALRQTAEQTPPCSSTQTTERNRGRWECRQVAVFLPSPAVPLPTKWKSVHRIIQVKRTVERHHEVTEHTHYYISDVRDDRAEFFAQGIRGHWAIENRLHYVKDVNLHEDTSGIKSPVAASNLSLLSNIAINLIRQNDFQSIKQGAIFFASNVKKLLQLVVG